jgi:hypothetical protein
MTSSSTAKTTKDLHNVITFQSIRVFFALSKLHNLFIVQEPPASASQQVTRTKDGKKRIRPMLIQQVTTITTTTTTINKTATTTFKTPL